jgi:hypothetical protein
MHSFCVRESLVRLCCFSARTITVFTEEKIRMACVSSLYRFCYLCVSLPSRLFWTTLESIQLSSVTSSLGRCLALVPSVQTSAGWLRCLLDSLVTDNCCLRSCMLPNMKKTILSSGGQKKEEIMMHPMRP